MLRRVTTVVGALFWVYAIDAQTFTTLANFTGQANGEAPIGPIVQGIDGNFYGTTFWGGLNNKGTVFVMTPQGQLTTLYSFDGIDGSKPTGLMLAPDGLLYGTTEVGAGLGTIFQITPSGTLTTLHDFVGSDGEIPMAPPVQAFNGALCGTASAGGAGSGTLFQITRTGKLTLLHGFHGSDGYAPRAGLVQATNGLLYGTTWGSATIFSISLTGTFTQLYSFLFDSSVAVIQGADGNLYGTVSGGGANGYGMVFQVTPAGTLTVLHNFNRTDGSSPSGLIQGTNGNYYGTTAGGKYYAGTIYQLTPAGSLTTLHNFDNTDGTGPGALLQATDGNFYGTTSGGGSNYGTVFRLSMGLAPFLNPVPWFGNPGSVITILGTSLTGTTSVTFNGMPSKFTVVSPTAIRTTIPAGATTGTIQVVTPSGTLLSSVQFQVL